MTDYTKTTDFTSKDSLPSGDSGKIIRGAEFGTEFDNIETAVNSKSNIDNPSFTGNITVTGTVDGRDIAADGTKLDTIETSADVTDTANVTAAGAVMDSELTDITAVKALNQGVATTDSPTFAAVTSTGNVTVGGTVDGRDVAADGTKLDGIEAGATADQTAAQIKTAYESNADTNAFTDADHTKLDGIEASADVTDTTNVTAAGALMDSEVTNLDQVKAFDSADYATAAQGTTADNALPKTGGAMTGAITTNSTFDGRDVATDGTKLDGIEASADVTDTTNVTAAGAVMDSELTSEASVKALNQGVATTDSPTFAGATVNGTVEFDGLSGTGAVTVTDILDQDDMSGNSATALATQQSIKSYVDSQVATSDTLAEVLANGNTTGGTDVAFGDNDKAIFGASSDLQIYHDGSGSYIDDQGTGPIRIRSGVGGALRFQDLDGDDLINATSNGAVTLYHNNSAKLATTSTGIDVTGVITTDGMTTSADINFGDNDKAIFGAGNDLQIYHDGTHSRVDDTGTGKLILRGNDAVEIHKYTGEYMITAAADGAVTLYHDDSSKLATTSTGIDVTGSVTADGLTIETGATGLIATYTGASSSRPLKVNNYDGDFSGSAYAINAESSGGELALQTATKDRLKVASNGDISFYEDTGTTAKFFWDAADESLGIGTSSPYGSLHTQGTINTAWTSSSRATDWIVTENLSTTAGTYSGIEMITTGTGSAGVVNLACVDSGSGSGDFVVSTRNSGTFAERMRIDSSGNVGIGTDSPVGSYTKTLHIHGSGTGASLHLTDPTSGATASDGLEVFQYGADGYIWEREAGNLRFGTSATERMRIDSSGNLLLNTLNSPTTTKAIISSDWSATGTTNTGLTITGRQGGNWWNNGIHALGASGLVFSTGTSGTNGADATNERMRIDSSGNLLVGTTDSNVTNNSGPASQAGINIGTAGIKGLIASARYQGPPLALNRLNNDGSIAEFSKDGTAVGSIGTEGGDLTIGAGTNCGLQFNDGNAAIRPFNMAGNAPVDNAVSLGISTQRFKDLYLSGGVYLGGTGSANKLDDYEEGTWTVGFSGGSVTASNNVGEYTKIGRVVYFSYYSSSSTIASASGAAEITGLPFTVASGAQSYQPFYTSHNTFFGGSTSAGVEGYANAGNTNLVFMTRGTTTSASLVNGSTKYIMLAGFYLTTA